MEEDSVADNGSEPSDSKVAGSCRIKRAYSVGRTKLFLLKTKNTKSSAVSESKNSA